MGRPVETLSGDPSLELPELDAPPGEPLPLLESWLKDADARGVREPRALALATADANGRPSNRIVLLKQASPSIVFAFSADSRKGRELATNPRAAGTLYWRETLQQVVFEGPVERMSAAESDRLFAERPPSGQAAAVASHQGEELEDPERLRREADALARGDEPMRRPEAWSGYRLDPDLIEFWHGSPDRLHRRLLYTRADGRWTHRRLQP
ncbi:MAG TPA: pyridoxal 5'-phosphate synthase [Solirubrobacterales bacterium]|nr:pyridoxal 5'-phosphate synthase [Solirubrobacterales bacterium]